MQVSKIRSACKLKIDNAKIYLKKDNFTFIVYVRYYMYLIYISSILIT